MNRDVSKPDIYVLLPQDSADLQYDHEPLMAFQSREAALEHREVDDGSPVRYLPAPGGDESDPEAELVRRKNVVMRAARELRDVAHNLVLEDSDAKEAWGRLDRALVEMDDFVVRLIGPTAASVPSK